MKRRAVLMMVVVLTVFSHLEYVFADVMLDRPGTEYMGPGIDITGIISEKDLLAVKEIAVAIIAYQHRSKEQGKSKLFTTPTFRLFSQGGDIRAAIEIGRQIRKMSAKTVVPVPGQCYSACVFIFAGGVERMMFGELGIHRPYSIQTGERNYDTVQKEQRETAGLAKAYLQEMNVLPALYDAMVTVPPDKLRILSRSEIIEFGLGVDPVHQEIENASDAKRYNLSMPLYLSRKAEADSSCSFSNKFSEMTSEERDAEGYELYQCSEAIMYGLSISEYVRRQAMATSECNKKIPPPRDTKEKKGKFGACYLSIIEGRSK